MRGRKLSFDEIQRLKEDTKVLIDYGDEEVVAEIKHSNFIDINGIERECKGVTFRYLTETKCGGTFTAFIGRVYEWVEEYESVVAF